MKDNDLQRDSVVHLLRLYGGRHALLTRSFARWLGLNATDGAVLTEVIHAEDSGAPATPVEVADRLGVSRSGLSASLNRLEVAGYIVRTAHPHDRRRTHLQCNRSIYRKAEKFFIPTSKAMDEVLARLSDEEVKSVERFLQQAAHAVMRSIDNVDSN